MEGMTAGGEHVLWSHPADGPPAGRPRALLAGAALLTVALLGAVAGVRADPFAALLGLAMIAGTVLLVSHLLRSRRRTIQRVWTDPDRPGVVLLRRDDGAVRAVNPARIRKIVLVHTSGAYRDERPGERVEWHGYLITHLTLRAGLTWYTTPAQTLPGDESGGAGQEQPSRTQTPKRLAAAFPNARISERHVHLSGQEATD